MTESAPETDPRPGRPGWARPEILAALAIALSAAAQLPAVRGGFFSDDALYYTDNPALLAIPLSKPWLFFAHRTNPWEYLPVRDLSYRVDAALFGMSPLALHVENVVLYALACAAFFLAARAVVRALRGVRGDEVEGVLAVAAVAFFAAHPAHVESVAWIASRKDLLSGAFVLAALWQLAEALAPERPAWRRIAGAAVLYALALLSKVSVLPLAPLALLLALARYVGRAPARAALARALAAAAPFVAIAGASVLVAARFAAVERAAPELDAFLYRPVGPIPLALRILGTFAHVAVAPVRLRLHYDVRVDGLAGAALVAAGLAAAGLAVAGAWLAVRRRSIAGFGAAAFGLFTLPFLQLLPFRTWSEACERWLFMPTLGLALAAAALVAWGARRVGLRPAAAVAAVAVTAGLLATAHRSWEWASAERLIESSLARAPTHPAAVAIAMGTWAPQLRHAEARAAASRLENEAMRTRLLLVADGWQAIAEGRREDLRRVVAALSSFVQASLTATLEAKLAEAAGDDFEAVRLYSFNEARGPMRKIQERYRPRLDALRSALERRPDDVALLGALGALESELRLDAEAVETYRRIVRLHPDLHGAHYNLAMVLLREKEHAEAAAEYRLAARGIPDAWNGLGLSERAMGHMPEAEAAFRNALAADPRAWKPAYNLASTYLLLGRREDARGALLACRERAAASDAPLAPIDVLLSRLGP